MGQYFPRPYARSGGNIEVNWIYLIMRQKLIKRSSRS